MKYAKYHALGNDYIVMRPGDIDKELVPDIIRLIYHRNFSKGFFATMTGPVTKVCDGIIAHEMFKQDF